MEHPRSIRGTLSIILTKVLCSNAVTDESDTMAQDNDQLEKETPEPLEAQAEAEAASIDAEVAQAEAEVEAEAAAMQVGDTPDVPAESVEATDVDASDAQPDAPAESDEPDLTAEPAPAAGEAAAAAALESELPARLVEKRAAKRRRSFRGKLVTVLIVIACLLIVLGGAAGFLYYHDDQMADTIPAGVSFYNASFGGLNKSEVHPKVESILDGLGAQEIKLQTIEASETAPSQTVTVKDFVSFDTTGIVNNIMSVRDKMPLLQRLRYDWLHYHISRKVSLPYSIDQTAVAAAVANLAKTTNAAAVDATLTLPDGSLTPVITPEKPGFTIETSTTAARLSQAIKAAVTDNQAQSFTIQAQMGAAKVTAADLAKEPLIVVALSRKQMYLYKGTTLVRTMITATGKPGFETRPGDYFIGEKRYAPTWINPHEDWSKSMPDRIGPGPGNPLGARAMNVVTRNAKGQIVDYGYRIHGGTVGAGASSHGCLHLSNSDVIWLYDQVDLGTPVLIRP